MTNREKKAKIEAYEAEEAEMKNHRKPSDKTDKLAVESLAIEQSYKENKKALEVSNSRDAKTILSTDTSIKAISYDLKEEKSKGSERQ